MSLAKISVVQYLNTVPLVWGMLRGEQQGQFDISFTTPSLCADALRQRKVDVGIIPSIEYQRLDKAQIIAGISIAAKGEVKSVLLLSKVPIAKIQTVAVDNSSRTSAALLRLMMRKFYSRFITATPLPPKPDDMLKKADAALLIGDPALTFKGQVARCTTLEPSGRNSPDCLLSLPYGWDMRTRGWADFGRISRPRAISVSLMWMISQRRTHPSST